MPDYTLQVGDELVLGDDTRLTVLAVERDGVVLGITAPDLGCVTLGDLPEDKPPPRAAPPKG
jgi:hypothetical protein